MAANRSILISCLLLTFLVAVAPARAGSHLWRFNEIFSNADGSIQFIEFLECCGSEFERNLSDKWIRSDATGNVFNFPSNLTVSTANRHLLMATAGFAALPGAPTPDFIIPDGFFALDGDTLRYWIYEPTIIAFGPGDLPLDGVTSLNVDLTTGLNSPTNFAGETGSVVAPVCNDVDGDGYGLPGDAVCPNGPTEDCNDDNINIHPGAFEVCDDTIDNDCDELIDCDDPGCASNIACIAVPAASAWGLGVLALLLMSAATVVLARLRWRSSGQPGSI